MTRNARARLSPRVTRTAALFLCAWLLLGCEIGAEVVYSPPVIPLEISIDTAGHVSLSTRSVGFATPVGTFGIRASARGDLFPEKRNLTVRYNGRDTIYELAEGVDFRVEFDDELYAQVAFEQQRSGDLFLELRSVQASAHARPAESPFAGTWKWDLTSDGARMETADDRWVFRILQPDTVRQYYLDEVISDFGAAVNARQTGGARSSAFGLVFRHQGHQDCYRFTLTGNGEFELGREVNNQWEYFAGYGGKNRHSCIRSGGEWNQIEIVCRGSSITAYVNGCEVAHVTDSSFSRGHVGLLVGTEEGGDMAVVEFAGFSLNRP